MRTFYYILILITTISLNAQEKGIEKCPLLVENIKWADQFNMVDSKAEQIELIKEKIYLNSSFPENNSSDNGLKNCNCKIIFYFKYSEKPAIELNLRSKPRLRSIVKLLDKENVNSITWNLDVNQAQKILGFRENCGFVIMETNNKKLKRKLKNVW